jgi:hypothetical protein
MKSLSRIAALSFAAGLSLLAACGGNKPVASPIANNAPEWVNKGSGAFKDGGQGVFYGVGIADGIHRRALAVTTSDDRARAEIAKIMNTYVAVLNKDYMASVSANDPKASSEEQMVSQTLKSFAKFTLHGAIIIDHWTDPKDGTIFALCKLDMKAVEQSLNESKELDAKVRDYVKANAEKAFDELNAEESKGH